MTKAKYPARKAKWEVEFDGPSVGWDPEIDLADRQLKALKLRNSGASLERIADQLGTTRQQVTKLIADGLRELSSVSAEELVGNQQAIIRDVVRAMYTPMLQGDAQAARQIMVALDHQAKLFGLYAPTKILARVSDEDFAETAARLMKEIGAGLGQDAVDGEVVDAEEWVIGS